MNTLSKIMTGFISGIIVTLAAGGVFFYNKNRSAQPLTEVKVT